MPDSAAELAARLHRRAGAGSLALVTRERSLLLRFAANRPTQATAVDDVTLEVAVLRDGHVGRATTNSPEDSHLEACVDRARAAAAAAASSGRGSFPGFPAPAASSQPQRGFDPLTAELDPQPGGAALRGAFSVARDARLAAHGVWTVGEVERAVHADAGGVAERATDAFMKVICIAPGSGRSGYAAQTAAGYGEIDARSLTERAAEKVAMPSSVAEISPRSCPVVFEPHAVGELLDLLAVTALDGLAHAEGRGALAGRLGRRVAAPAINLSDSPSYGRTLPRGFDAEGVAKRPLPLIQDGVAHRVVHDTRSAALARGVSTGHALTPGGDGQGPHPTNLVLAGGGASGVDELCEPIERGVYVTRLWYANVIRPAETLVTAVTRDGTFLIEDGRVTRPLRDLRLTDSVLSILSNVQALTAAHELVSGAELYGRRFAHGAVCPALRAGSVRFTDTAG